MISKIMERVYFTDAEILAIMEGMANAAGNVADGPATFFPVGGGGKRDFKYFREFLEGIEYAQRNLECGSAADGYKRVTGMADENNERVFVRDMNPYEKSVAIPFESTLKESAEDLVGAVVYVGERARKHGFERIYVAAIRDHLGIANVVGIPQYEEFIGIKEFMKTHYRSAYERLGENGAMDLIADVSPEEIDIDEMGPEKDPGVLSRLSGSFIRMFWSKPEFNEQSRAAIRKVIRSG